LLFYLQGDARWKDFAKQKLTRIEPQAKKLAFLFARRRPVERFCEAKAYQNRAASKKACFFICK
jgi:hypothetical protein